MELSRTVWLSTSAGIRLPIKAAGVLLGRSPHCDVVLGDATTSRVQLIVFAGVEGPSLSVLGKAPTSVNGEAVTHDRELRPGDRIDVPGLTVTIEVEDAATDEARPTWLVRGPGGMFGVVRSPFLVGAGSDADLRLDRGPAHLLRFHAGDRLEVEALVPLWIAGNQLAAGDRAQVVAGGRIVTAIGAFEILDGGDLGQAPTQQDLTAFAGPRRVRLEFLARGGRLSFDWRGCPREVYLPERRCDLIAALLQPPPPFVAGDFVPDEILLPRVWSGRVMSRVDLNTILHRARQDLARADAGAGVLLARAEGGNATRFTLGADSRVEVA